MPYIREWHFGDGVEKGLSFSREDRSLHLKNYILENGGDSWDEVYGEGDSGDENKVGGEFYGRIQYVKIGDERHLPSPRGDRG